MTGKQQIVQKFEASPELLKQITKKAKQAFRKNGGIKMTREMEKRVADIAEANKKMYLLSHIPHIPLVG